MNVWTNGTRSVVVGPHGLSLHGVGETRLLVRPEEIGEELRRPNRWVEAWHAYHPMAVDAAGERLFVVARDRRFATVDLEAGRIDELESPVLDITRIPDADDYVAVIKEDERVSVRRGEWRGDRFEWGDAWSLPDEIPRVDWPDVIWMAGEEPWRTTTELSNWSGAFRVSATSHGIAVSDCATGIVAFADADAMEGFSRVHRLPGMEEADLYVVATADGWLVLVVASGRESTLLSYDSEGELRGVAESLGDRELYAGQTLELVDDRRGLLVTNRGGQPVVSLFDVSSLELLAERRVSKESHGPCSLSVGRGAEKLAILLGTGMRAHRAELDRSVDSESLSEFAELELPDPTAPAYREAEALEGVADFDPVSARNDTVEPAADGSFDIEFEFQNVGGPCSGLVVEVSGGCVATGAVAFDYLDLGGSTHDFQGDRATLPDLDLPPALRRPDGELEPAAPVQLRLYGTVEGGGGMLMVSVQPIGGTQADAASITRRIQGG